MDGFINSKIEKQMIYEIYRACRLCGAGAGYKMPIIQNVVPLDATEVELKQKIRDCVQIEVHEEDKMPPLICELCVDKVNDFYEFVEMCRQTNKRTRLRLGLPPQTLPRGAPDAGDCILGVTEPIFVANEDSNEPILKSKGKHSKSAKGKKEFQTKDGKNKANVPQKKEVKKEEVKIKIEPRTLRSKAPSPPRLRGTKRPHDDDLAHSRSQKTRKPEQPQPRSILKRSSTSESKSEDSSRLRRSREKDKGFTEKKVKIVLNPLPPRGMSKPPSSKSSQMQPWKCKVCRTVFNNSRSLNNHLRTHSRPKPVEKIPPKKPSQPRKIECRTCKREFPHKNMLDIHRCNTRPAKPSRPVAVQKPVAKPQRALPSRKRGIDRNLLKQVRPFQVRTARCDPLLDKKTGDHYDVSDVDCDFGLDKRCIYPFISFKNLHIKSEPGYMVNIQDEIKNVFDFDDNYVHWDSEDETDSDVEFTEMKKVGSLTSLTLKTIFSQKFLGKVPKKRRKIKVDNAFDSMLNASDYAPDIRQDIHNIIDRLDEDKDKSAAAANDSVLIDKSHDDSDSLFGDDKTPAVTNDDFDALFNTKDNSHDKIAKFNESKDTSNEVECNNKVNGEISRKRVNISDNSAISLSDIIKETESLNINESDKFSDSDSRSILFNDGVTLDQNDGSSSLETESDGHRQDHVNENNSIKVENSDEKSSIGTDEKAKDTKVDVKLDINSKNINNTEKSDDVNIDTNNVQNDFENDKSVTDSNISNILDSHTELGDMDSRIDEVNKTVEDKKDILDNHTGIREMDSRIDEVNKTVDVTNNETLPVAANGLDLDEAFNMDDLEDVSDTEMEDRQLMEALDAQIYESETGNTKSGVCERDAMIAGDEAAETVKSADLESISDGEFE